MNGDYNTKYFHAYANQQRHKNHIKQIVEEQNMFQDQVENIKEVFWSFFDNLFTSAAPSSHDIALCTNRIQPKVSEEMNTKLLRKFTKEEVEIALN